MASSDGKKTSLGSSSVSDSAMALLVEAGAVLATSLDLQTTMGQVAQLTVPQLADLCTIDLLDQDGSITEAAVAAADPQIATALEELRAKHPLDPRGGHPVACVIRSGEPELQPQMGDELLRSFAQGSAHARFMIAHRYRSAAVAPLLARGRTLGALSALRLGDALPFDEQDMALVSELARRAGLAIDNARLFSEMRRIEQRLEAILVNLAEAVAVVDEQGRLVFANQAAAELLGAASPSELAGRHAGEAVAERFLLYDEQGRELAPQQEHSSKLFAAQRPRSDAPQPPRVDAPQSPSSEPQVLRSIVRTTGNERWLVARSSPVADPENGQALYTVNVFEDITDFKRAQLAETFLADAGKALASSMDFAETLQRLAQLAVSRLGDWCAVHLIDDGGGLECVVVHPGDPAKAALAEGLANAYRPKLDEAGGLPEVIRSGRARLITEIHADALAAHARDAKQLALLREIEANAVIIVPMLAASRTIGTITLVSSQASRRLSEADLGVAEELGRRAGTAVENARLYTERTRIAHTLQQALLPESLPEIPGSEIEARYSPAGELNEAGGDFYDVFACDEDRWMLVIGDVCGKGPEAAGVTALARHTLRAAAMSGQAPLEMLRLLHRELRRQPVGADLCTVCLVSVTRAQEGVRLGVALAGHPQPLLVRRDGEVRRLGDPGTLLGVIDPIEVSERFCELLPGETLLLYTDGVAEAGRSSGTLSEQGLIELCKTAPAQPLARLLASIEWAALERAAGARRDDIALLALRPQQR
ncbi:MAG TPA: SpoIIE family protein phosphatase [Solirubrobacteraceae bacterium]|jgi:serine phosphatase RsbU (regulator of sigma subunit)/PAS domain-containing protein